MKNILILLLFLISFKGYSQNSIPHDKISLNAFTTAGGDSTENEGSISFSVGQVFYLSQENSNISLQEGVQQAFSENSKPIPSVVEEENENEKENPSLSKLKITVYPNPVTEFFTVDLSSLEESVYSYQLFDLQGRLLLQGSLSNLSTKIHPKNLQSSVYILKIYNHNLPVKSFKIIKK
ncbi:T9SS type A sorting domain-containing protein [Zunongwangia sp. F363]|uniref:T9SS type A sorting domain-containing protein n=1 Tax=Autumnicola tepida TaxID=3075595 RepID=A0ABU3CBS5_9FLAO|nr:T9SS type A sorting domain-containing protein [Zunongwangia sp. F363]MDT0643785.1 T9SS type A sorting domain-containing protein [Zunongwangia sp. F363]